MVTKYTPQELDAHLDKYGSILKAHIATGIGKSTFERRSLQRKMEAKASTLQQQERNLSVANDGDGVKELFIDIETLPNLGYFFDVYSDRGIPLDFIEKPKSICTLAYKFSGDESPTVLIAHEPYNDKALLMEFVQIVVQADYVIAHFGDGFDLPFIEGRLFANGLPPLPPFASIDTYKLARNKFKKTLNSNKLDHLAKICGLQGKNKTNAMLWVGCARGDLDAIKEMAEYNAQDIEVLEAVYKKLKPNVKSKLNHNLKADSPTLLCRACGSDNLTHRGYELKAQTMSHRWQCKPCGAWTTTPVKKEKK